MLSVFYLVCCVVLMVSLWKIFVKCGEKGYYSLIPVYNTIVMLRIADWPIVKIFYFLIPFYNIYLVFVLYKAIAGRLGQKSSGFALGMLLLPYIFFPVLAFKK